MAPIVKQEIAEPRSPLDRDGSPPVIHVSSDDDSDWGSSDGEDDLPPSAKRPRVSEESGGRSKKLRKAVAELPSGFLDPLPTGEDMLAAPLAVLAPKPISVWPPPAVAESEKGSRQFWKAGDYEGKPTGDYVSLSAGMDHVRVHPKFLHSNATSHKWALGAFAELLDNSIDEVSHGATFVNVDMLESKKDRNKMLLVEDNGGGMDPDRMRQCVSLGYSMKSKSANTIGQYGNGFKTSTMRLGADVIVFSRCRGKGGRSPTQSIGMLSYTFLRDTAKENIVVPMIDYEKGEAWNRLTRSSSDVWNKNLETILQWSPYSSEIDLLKQFDSIGQQGTRIVIYNLWDDDQGELELDFDADVHDIQVRGVNRDDKKIEMAKQFPNSRHFLTYRHSLRSYASILYLRLPHGFRMILRGKEIEHHNIVNDMMMMQNVIYRPVGGDGVPKDQNMVADVTIGFVKDAKDHIDIQGFNVYHKNRLIKPFWRLWNAAGSDGRGVIGVLEANFVEPAHDKQDFERTTVLSRLEARLVQMQKAYWTTNCHKIGYAPRRNKKVNGSEDKESSLETLQPSSQHPRKVASRSSIYPDVSKSKSSTKHQSSDKSSYLRNKARENGASLVGSANGKKVDEKLEKNINSTLSGLHGRSHAANDKSGLETECIPTDRSNLNHLATRPHFKGAYVTCTGNGPAPENSSLSIKQLTEENKALKSRIKEMEEKLFHELQSARDQNKALAEQLKSVEMKLEESKKEQEALIDIFSEERCRRDADEENLRKRLKGASNTIQELVEKLCAKDRSVKPER